MEPGSEQDQKPSNRLTSQKQHQPVIFGIYQERRTPAINQNCNVALVEPHEQGRGEVPMVHRKSLPRGSFIYEEWPTSFRNAFTNYCRASFEEQKFDCHCHKCLYRHQLHHRSFENSTYIGSGSSTPSFDNCRYFNTKTRRLTPPNHHSFAYSSHNEKSPTQLKFYSQHSSWDHSSRWTSYSPSENSSSAQLLQDQHNKEVEMNTRPSTEGSTRSLNMGDNLVKTPTLTEKKENVAESTAPSTAVASPPQMPQQQHPTWSTFHDWLFIFTVCLAQFISLATLAQTVAPLLIIGDFYGTQHPGQLAWFTASYSMTLGTFILPSGRLGDIFGHKRIFLLGWLYFSMISFLAGLGHSWGTIGFSVIRGFQGIGPALLVPNAMALIGRTYPIGDKRALVLSLFGACGPTGFLTGALFSSMFAQVAWWPWSFWSTAMFTTFVTFLAYCVVPDSLATGAPGLTIKHFDFLGCFTGVTGLLLINFALNQAPLVGWSTQYVYFILIIGVILTLGFIYVELYMTKHPLVPIRGLQPQAVLTLGCIAAGWASHGIWIYYLFMFFERVRGQTAVISALELIPVGPIGVAFALSTMFLIKKVGVARVMLLSMLFFLIGTIFLAIAPAKQTYWGLTFLSIIVMPGGMNLSFPAGTILLSNSMPKEHQGKAASMISTIVNYSIASGLGFAGTIERKVNDTGTKILQGYRGAWYMGIGFASLGVVLSLYFCWTMRTRKTSST